MGIIHTSINLKNPKKSEKKSMEVTALVDTGALLLGIPEHVAFQLGLEELEKREVVTADGKTHIVPYVGPIEIHFENRTCFSGALVMGDEVILGAVPMEDLDVIISPADRKIIVNPRNPNMAFAQMK